MTCTLTFSCASLIFPTKWYTKLCNLVDQFLRNCVTNFQYFLENKAKKRLWHLRIKGIHPKWIIGRSRSILTRYCRDWTFNYWHNTQQPNFLVFSCQIFQDRILSLFFLSFLNIQNNILNNIQQNMTSYYEGKIM